MNRHIRVNKRNKRVHLRNLMEYRRMHYLAGQGKGERTKTVSQPVEISFTHIIISGKHDNEKLLSGDWKRDLFFDFDFGDKTIEFDTYSL
ncbi:hypothetical protein CEXT_768971 [Caerostris extrusa]|uniref:Uncharacterized protein n=1 Tax=Caerostris extrusa TaxID=172846 RepID=A0AAV4V4M7_CAEEX|nr:hypothetical protein CEXT_768971 [Caerostris extrusa]